MNCTKDCIYRQTGTKCECQENNWEVEDNNDEGDDVIEAKIGMPTQEQIDDAFPLTE